MASVPPDFGGLLAYWREGKAYLSRYGRGQAIEGIQLTPLNLLQAHKLLGQLVAIGRAEGLITEEHERQSEALPSRQGLDNIIPRDQVDRIAGPD